MKKVLAKVDSTPKIIDFIKSKKGVSIGGKTISPIVFDYLKAHPDERMYISRNKNTVESIYVKAVKWLKEGKK